VSQHIDTGCRCFAALDESGAITGISVVRADPIGMFELYTMAVHPEAQGQAIGRQFVAHAVYVARSEGFRCVEVAVFAERQDAPVAALARAGPDGAPSARGRCRSRRPARTRGGGSEPGGLTAASSGRRCAPLKASVGRRR
jgi:GNAT superfamily N-acetyltransferase